MDLETNNNLVNQAVFCYTYKKWIITSLLLIVNMNVIWLNHDSFYAGNLMNIMIQHTIEK